MAMAGGCGGGAADAHGWRARVPDHRPSRDHDTVISLGGGKQALASRRLRRFRSDFRRVLLWLEINGGRQHYIFPLRVLRTHLHLSFENLNNKTGSVDANGYEVYLIPQTTRVSAILTLCENRF